MERALRLGKLMKWLVLVDPKPFTHTLVVAFPSISLSHDRPPFCLSA